MIKKFFLTTILSFSAAIAFADTAENDSVEYTPALQKDRWYLQVFAGANHSMNENLDRGYHHFCGINKESLGAGGFVAYGREFTPIWGARLSFGYDSNKARAQFYNENPRTYAFHNMEVFLDGTVDICDLIAPDLWWEKLDAKVFVGFGFTQTFGFPKDSLSYCTTFTNYARPLWGMRGGINVGWRVSDDLRLGGEMSLTAFDDHFSGVADNYQFDGRINCSIGMTWVPQKKEKKKEVKDTINPLVVYLKPENEGVKHRQIAGSAYLAFPVNEVTIYADYMQNPVELHRICESIDVVKYDSTITITNIDIHGFASPEGPYDNNVRLSQGRAEALKKYLMKVYDFKESIVHVSSTPEDWDGLAAEVSNGNFRYKEDMLKVINNSSMEPDEREKLLEQVSGDEAYNFLREDIYIGLRHSDYKIDYTVRDYTLQEARIMTRIHPELLSLEELYNVATSYTKGSNAYLRVMKTAAKTYPDNQIANLNAANACIEAGQISEAIYYADKAGDLPEAIHARGVIAAIGKDYEGAKVLLDKSYSLGVEESAKVLK